MLPIPGRDDDPAPEVEAVAAALGGREAAPAEASYLAHLTDQELQE